MSLDVYLKQRVMSKVYSDNITHNLTDMAVAIGIYKHLWRPEEIGINQAFQLIEPLEAALAKLKKNREYCEQFNPPNGWGNYENLVAFIENYLEACRAFPAAEIEVSR